ncbi:MAG: phosphate/phosphite/phosphonate ABC transporter substrate-binding protein [Crinalium sp.]
MERLDSRSVASLVLALIVTALGVGCQPLKGDRVADSQTQQSTKPDQQSTSLNIAVIPSKNPVEQQKSLQPLAEYLTKTLGRQVSFQIAKDYKTPVNLIAEGQVQIAYLGSLAYVEAKQLNPQIQPIVAPINKETGRPWYTSVIVTNSNRISDVNDLKGKRFAFVSESSTSGYLMPLGYFKEMGIDPERDFTKVKFSGSHAQVKTELESGEVDAIANDKPSYLNEQKAGRFNPQKYKIIWESSPIPQGPIVVRADQLSPELVTNLKKALVSASEGLVDVNGAEAAGYTLVQDEDYEPIKKLQSQLNLKPGQAK